MGIVKFKNTNGCVKSSKGLAPEYLKNVWSTEPKGVTYLEGLRSPEIFDSDYFRWFPFENSKNWGFWMILSDLSQKFYALNFLQVYKYLVERTIFEKKYAFLAQKIGFLNF